MFRDKQAPEFEEILAFMSPAAPADGKRKLATGARPDKNVA